MNHPHMSAGLGHPHMPPAMPMHPHSRRQQEYHAYHHPQPQSPMHPYAAYPPSPYYPHPAGPPQYAPQRWQHPYPPQQFMPPPPPQHTPYQQPRSPMVVSSQPYNHNMTSASRHTPVPHHAHPHQQAAQSPRPIPPHVQPHAHPSVAPPSPAPTPTYQQEHETSRKETPPAQQQQQPPSRRQSVAVNPLSLPAEHKQPFYPQLPWYSIPLEEAAFPPRDAARRRRKHSLSDIESVALPSRDGTQQQRDGQAAVEHMPSEAPTIAAPSQPETPATSQPPSESAPTQASTPATPTHAAVVSPKDTPHQAQHNRKDTRTAIAVPNIPGFGKYRPSTAEKPAVAPQSDHSPAVQQIEESKEAVSESAPVEETTTPATPPSKPAPKSWADLVRQKNKAFAAAGMPNGNAIPNGIPLSKSASLAEALRQYSVDNDANFSFLEPRGLVNTGNMCYMNSILQVLVFCVPFYDFLDQVRQRTVHSMKSDTPLVDAMIMFMREFKVLASAESVEGLKRSLGQQQVEQYGEPVTPEYVYDAIRKLDRFNSMRRGHQQDAEEFLGFLLEGLHDECEHVMQTQIDETPKENGMTSPGAVTSPTSADGWLEVGPKQKSAITRTAGTEDAPSPITKIFGGHLRSELRVPGQKDSVTREPYKPLQLDIGAPHVNNIVDALKGLTRTESLTGTFGGKTQTAKKQVFIDTLPPVLILHLKRFQYDSTMTGTQKIWKKVGYPLDLEIPKDVFPPSKRGGLAVKGGLPHYRLISVVYHHGKSAAGGHYTVDVRREDGREWVRIDDTVIRRIRPEDVAEGGAEEDPKLLAKALEQHKADQDLQKQRNIYQGLDEAEREPEVEKPWSEVNGAWGPGERGGAGHGRKWSSIANTNGTATPVGGSGKAGWAASAGRREGVRDNKVAYMLLYERVRD